MQYGIPYMGSKNSIAEDVVNAIPPGGKILDACCGGGAVLMALAMIMKFDAVVGNIKILRIFIIIRPLFHILRSFRRRIF